MPVSTAVDPSAVARVVGIKTIFKDLRQNGVLFLRQRIAVIAQGASAATYALTKEQMFSAAQAGQTYGFGSPMHLIMKQLLPANGDGVGTIPVTAYPLEDDGSGAVSAGDITPGGAQTVQASYQITINNILSEPFVIAAGDSVATITAAMTAAINANLDMPMIAVDGSTVVNLTSKWAGTTANDLSVNILGSTTAGTTFVVTQPTGGLVNPDIQPALDQIGGVWETKIMNAMGPADTVAMEALAVFNEGRWAPTVRKPFQAYFGNTEVSVTTAITVPESRKTDRTNIQLVSPASNDLEFIVAARQLARIAVVANNNPPRDYGSQKATGLTPGADGSQWTYLQRDTAVKGGSSTIEVKDGVVNLSDTVTFYHPSGEPIPAYRYDVDNNKVMNILFNLGLIFATEEWDGAPLIPDADPTTNPTAKKPRMAIAEVATLIDSLGLNAIISDPETAKKSIVAEIDTQNPKRLNLSFTVQLSGNANIISIDFNFGFFFGTAAIVA